MAAIHEQGSELGVHSFSHPDLGTKPRWRVDRELAETQLAISGAAGVTTFLLRPPYSSSADAIDNLGWSTVQAAGEDGYVTVFTTDDSEDWQRPGIDAIIRNATPKPDDPTGSVVLMHDAGGDRSETVAALDKWIPLMKAKGFKFATVAGASKGTVAEVTASPHDRFTGSVLVATLTVATNIVAWLSYLLIIVGVLVGVRLILMVVYARRHAKRRRRPDFSWGPPVDETVTVIVPAYNEIKNIEATVRSIVANDHPLEVLVVDDGSTDGTPEKVESLGIPNVRVLRQKNSGKPKALNAGIRAAKHEIIIMIDGDTVFEPDTVRLLAQPFADPTVGAVAGNVKIANRDELIGRMQHIEYVVGFNIDRRVQDVTGSIITVPGAGGSFRRKALLQVGGMSTDTLAEDTDLTIALGRAGWRVVFEERARAWTEAPATMAQLWKQRYRWSYGTMQAMWKHRGAVRREGVRGQGRAARARARGRVPHPPAAHRAAGRRLLPLRPGVRRPGPHAAARRRDARRAAAHGVLRVPAGARAARRAVGVPRAADRLPAADVLRAHPVGRERGERRRRALAADEPHRCAEQPAAEAVRRARPGSGQRPHLGARAAQQATRSSGAGKAGRPPTPRPSPR